MNVLKERVALVTGAGSGMGAATACELAKVCRVVIGVDIAGADYAEVRARCEALGSSFVGVAADISDEQSVAEAFKAVEKLGRLDIVVNCAGIARASARPHATKQTVLEDWNRVVAVNLTGTFLICRAAIPHLKRNGWGRIVTISSMAARVATATASAHYGAAKAGVLAFTRVLALELASLGVTVNCVAPGLTQSRMTSGNWDLEAYGKMMPLGRVGQPLDIAEAIAFLTSDAAEYITGATLDVNGGYFMA